MALNRTNFNFLVDDDGTNLTGTRWDKAHIKDVILDPVDAEFVVEAAARVSGIAAEATLRSAADAAEVTARNAAVAVEVTNRNTAIAVVAATVTANAPAVTAPTTTGTQTALALPVGTGPLVIHANNATLLTVQGIAAGLSGQLLTIISKGAGQIDFAHAHASGTALGKLRLFATVGLTSLVAGRGVAVFQYDATLTIWRLIAHEQGGWIVPAFVAGDYTASGSMVWTVDAADIEACRYVLRGRTLTVELSILSTTISGTPANSLNRTLFGFTATHSARHVYFNNDNGVFAMAVCLVSTGIDFRNNLGATANFTAVTNGLHLMGVQFSVEVQ